MPVIDVMGGSKVEKVLQDTWGHLAPEPGREYSGWILAARTVYGDAFILDYHFDDLCDSPWFCDGMHGFIFDEIEVEPGLYRFEGTYEFTPAHWVDDDHHEPDNHEFVGGPLVRSNFPGGSS